MNHDDCHSTKTDVQSNPLTVEWKKLTAAETQRREWAGLDWSRWYDLTKIQTVTRPYVPGVYRLRHVEYDGLVYIGETGQKQGLNGRRLPALADNVYEDKRMRSLNPEPKGEPHTAAPSLVKLCHRAETKKLEVSYATPQQADHSKWMRRGIEAALIALHRLASGRSPWAFESRPENNDWSQHAPSLSWHNWESPRSNDWMGLDWTTPRRLGDLDSAVFRGLGVYRIWNDNSEGESLRYIGEGDVTDRLRSHTEVDGEDAYYSAASLPRSANDENQKHRRDVEVELIGAHFLTENRPPLRQFKRDPENDDGETSIQSRLF